MRISILGCGWLGFPLAQHLMNKNHKVKGSTTTSEKKKELEKAGIESFCFRLPEDLKSISDSSFWDCDLLFINIPPGRKRDDVCEYFPGLIENLVEVIETHSIGKVIFISSTSVYSPYGGITTEEEADYLSAARDSGRALLKAEELVMNSKSFDTVIIRFGGLYGYDRHPVKYLAGKKNLKSANKPVNLIHLDDCIAIIDRIIESDFKPGIYNAVSDGHPPREAFYKSAANHFHLPEPEFLVDDETDYRVVSNQKLKDTFGYKFMYPNPMDHTP